MRRAYPLFVFVPLLLALAWPARAGESVMEVWRSPFGIGRSVSVNPADGSCWAATGGSVMHLAADGSVLSQSNGFFRPPSVSVNPTDGSCWVADQGHRQVVHLAGDGSELWRGGHLSEPCSVSVNSADGSVWVADAYQAPGYVVHLSAGGAELWRGSAFYRPTCVSVNPSDGSVWVADRGDEQVVHLGANGSELWRGGVEDGALVAVSPADGSVWVSSAFGSDAQLVHLAATGAELWRSTQYGAGASVNPTDGSVWAITPTNEVVHLAASGSELWRGRSFTWTAGYCCGWYAGVGGSTLLSVNPTDGSVWVADYDAGLAHLGENGSELWRGRPIYGGLAVNVTDGSCWVSTGAEIIHLAENGADLWRGPFARGAGQIAVNPTDGSIWEIVSETDPTTNQLVHLASDGSELWRGAAGAATLALNSADGSVWVGDTTGQLVHLAPSGAELWRGSLAGPPTALSANPADGSVWVAAGGDLLHLSVDGTELRRLSGFGGGAIGVDPAEGSFWVVRPGYPLYHYAADGLLLWASASTADGGYPWVNPADGSVWFSAENWYRRWNVDAALTHIAADGTQLWQGMNLNVWSVSVNPSDSSVWVVSGWDRQIVHLAIGPPVADFLASPTIGPAPLPVGFTDLSSDIPTSWAWDFGDGESAAEWNPRHTYTAPGHHTVTLTVTGDFGLSSETKERYILVHFKDVAPGHWAFYQVIACVDAGIVKGYDDGSYQPTWTVTRDQMAVYISRALAGGDACVPTGPATATFSDVPSTHWAYKHIEYAVSQNVVKGYDDGTYLPSVTVDRGQMAVYVARAVVAPGGDAAIPDPVPPATFPDVSDTYWAYKQVEYCVGQGVVKGYDDGNYHPGYPVTRDQMAVYVARAFGLL